MQGMIENVRRTALKTKIRGEMALLDRQIYLLQCQFGIDYYDAVAAFGQQHRRFPIPSAIADAFDHCRDDIQVKLNEKNAKDLEVEYVVVNKERSAALPKSNTSTLQRSSQWVNETATEGKLRVQVKLLERDMKLRKEQFGVAVFDVVLAHATQKTNHIKGAIQNVVNAAAGDERKVDEVLRNAAREIGILRQQKQGKERELQAVDQGVL
jgi:rRNA-processing protein FCF1